MKRLGIVLLLGSLLARRGIKLGMRNLMTWMVLYFMALPLLAHHGRGAAYNNDAIMTINGSVTEWAYQNPPCGALC